MAFLRRVERTRYRDPRLQKLFDDCLRLVEDKTSEFWYKGKPHRGAGHRCAFWDGAAGLSRSANAIPNSTSWVCFQAGKEWARQQKLAGVALPDRMTYN